MKRGTCGFSLIEAIIVVVVLSLAAATLGTMMLTGQKKEAKVDYRAIEVRELSQLYHAVKAYTSENASAFNATAKAIPIADLISAGKLPDDFATRGGAIGQTPWRQTYTIYGRVGDDGKVQSVIHEGSVAASVPSLERTGTPNTAQSIAALKADIATKVTTTYKIPAATIDAGQRTAKGALGAFSKDLTALMPAVLPQASAAVLVGFADLEPPGPGTGGPASKWRNCTIKTPRKVGIYWQAATCPTGTQNIVQATLVDGTIKDGIPYCRREHPTSVEPRYTAYPTDIGALTIDPIVDVTSDRWLMDWNCTSRDNYGACSRWDPLFGTFENKAWNERVLLNGAEIYVSGIGGNCRYDGSNQGYKLPGRPCANGDPTEGVKGCLMSGRIINQAVVDLGTDARLLLCCEAIP